MLGNRCLCMIILKLIMFSIICESLIAIYSLVFEIIDFIWKIAALITESCDFVLSGYFLKNHWIYCNQTWTDDWKHNQFQYNHKNVNHPTSRHIFLKKTTLKKKLLTFSINRPLLFFFQFATEVGLRIAAWSSTRKEILMKQIVSVRTRMSTRI